MKKLFDPVDQEASDDDDEDDESGSSWLNEPAEQIPSDVAAYTDVASVDFDSTFISAALADEATEAQDDKDLAKLKDDSQSYSGPAVESDDENFDVLTSDFM